MGLLKYNWKLILTQFSLLAGLSLSTHCGQQDINSKAPWKSYQDTKLLEKIEKSIAIPGYDVPEEFVRNYGDVLNAYSLDPQFLDDVKKATNTYGVSTINMESLSEVPRTQESSIQPWSAWWFPKFETALFSSEIQGQLSTLEKYDFVRNYFYNRTKNIPVNSAANIEKLKADPRALRWEGLCNAWALASITSREPTRPVSVMIDGKRIDFDIGDLKGLLLKTYEAAPDNELLYFGQKFTGSFDGWIHPDLFPEQLHRLVEVLIFDEKRPFIMDYDPGIEIWNVAVFKASYTMKAVPDDSNAVQVRLWLYSADPFEKKDINKTGIHRVIREYHYVLFGDRVDNHLTVKSGIWIKGPNNVDSRKDHPDYVITIPDKTQITRTSYNDAIENDIVDSIIKRSLND